MFIMEHVKHTATRTVDRMAYPVQHRQYQTVQLWIVLQGHAEQLDVQTITHYMLACAILKQNHAGQRYAMILSHVAIQALVLPQSRQIVTVVRYAIVVKVSIVLAEALYVQILMVILVVGVYHNDSNQFVL